jgi:hypothetical protein
MEYTHALGRQFWLDFDQHFKFEAGSNGLGAKYGAMGGYDRLGQEFAAAMDANTFPADFNQYVDKPAVTEAVKFLATAQSDFFGRFFGDDRELVVSAFQDFAFGVLASPNAPNRANEPVHTMNGGLFAADYLSWHGFIEGAIYLLPGNAFWENMRWINGMAWELQVKARPQEIYPNQNEPLSAKVTDAIRQKWQKRTADQIREEFKHYSERPSEWQLVG